MPELKVDDQVLETMRKEWDQRASENARYFVYSASEPINDREFFRSGEVNVANEIMPDMLRICGGTRSPFDLDVLEIGCGAGRMTKAMARIFRHVIAVDVSAEMVRQASSNLSDVQNVTLVVGDGASLKEVPDGSIDFAFSFIVFQHVPTYEVIASYCREVYRVLRPGSLFKLQVQGAAWERVGDPDTWYGVTFAEEDALRLSVDGGFVLERSNGAGTQYYWLWLRKPLSA